MFQNYIKTNINNLLLEEESAIYSSANIAQVAILQQQLAIHI